MYDIHSKANLIRAKGFDVEPPFDSLILGARNPQKIMNVRIGTRQDLRNMIRGVFRVLRSDWVMLGLLDPSNRGLLTAANNSGYLGVSRNQDLSDAFLADCWVVLRAIFEHRVTCDPDFLKLCADFINGAAYMQLVIGCVRGHC
jgi:hypothetical protein